MARKQVKKATTKKTNLKRTTHNSTKSLAQAMEKEFRDLPTKLISLLHKDANVLNKQEKQLKSELKKADSQKKVAKSKQATLQIKLKKSKTATNKKQLLSTKQTHEKILKTISGLQADLNQVKAQSKLLSAQQSKYTAITKLLSQLDKEWEAKSRTASKTATKTRKKTVKNTKRSASATHQDNHDLSESTSMNHAHSTENEMA